jgi:proline iminopeptidase
MNANVHVATPQPQRTMDEEARLAADWKRCKEEEEEVATTKAASMKKPPPQPAETPPPPVMSAESRTAQAMACLWPAIEPYNSDYLEVTTASGTVHRIYYEECGTPSGKPVLFVHGGPGAGCNAKQRRFHDPTRHRIILFDQRGCGRSTPDGCLDENTTFDLVADMERLREKLSVSAWQLFGGSWGSTLSLAYAVSHPARVTELILRGIFLVKQSELDFIYQSATPQLYPEAHAALANFVSPEERHDLVSAYRKRVMSKDPELARAAARRWAEYEDAIAHLYPQPVEAWEGTGGEQRVHLHYMWARGFFEYDGWLLDQLGTLARVPIAIVHGRYDVVCPIASAYELAARVPHATLQVIPDSGHSAWEPGTTRALVAAAAAALAAASSTASASPDYDGQEPLAQPLN